MIILNECGCQELYKESWLGERHYIRTNKCSQHINEQIKIEEEQAILAEAIRRIQAKRQLENEKDIERRVEEKMKEIIGIPFKEQLSMLTPNNRDNYYKSMCTDGHWEIL
jgi:hypothetical protein